jgi:glycosyltransferase involved in cell wall biosynthesis
MTRAGTHPEGAPTGTFSIVIPAYNEGARLGRTLDELSALSRTRGWEPEVIVVDDGSGDNTQDVALSHLKAFSSGKLISSQPNRGKGHAVRTGMLAATGDMRLFMDADGSTSLDEIPRFLAEAATKTENCLLIASIAHRDSEVSPQPGHRRYAGRLANWVIQLVALPGLKDTQRGFKLFSARASEEIFSRCTIDGWLFDVEALAIAKALGYTVTELPVRWEHREDSRVTGRSYLQTLGDLLRLRLRLWRGTYKLR